MTSFKEAVILESMDKDKFIDESWKENAAKEKEQLNKTVKEASASLGDKGKRQSGAPAPGQKPPAEAALKEEYASPEAQTSAHFVNYISSLTYQGMVFLGEIPNPMTNVQEKNLEQAKFVIDTLLILREKTKGNLSKQESDLLNSSIYELQMRYLESSQKE